MTKAEAVELIDERMCFGRGKWSEHHMPVIDDYWKAGQMAIKALEQSERKTGRWIEEHIDITDKEHPKSFRFHRCSACGHVAAPALFVDEEKWLSYCPHCGAYMRGGTAK